MTVTCQTRQEGFTLVEMMVVVAIMGIIAAMAYPSMQKQIAQMRLKDAVNMAELTFKQVRSDALVYQADVSTTMTPNTPPTATTLQISQTQNGNTVTQTKEFNPQVKVTLLNSMPTQISFTKTKRALDRTVTTQIKPMQARTTSGAPIGYCFNYNNVTVDKYILTVDALANINVLKDTTGACS